jgi:hypothetical protein
VRLHFSGSVFSKNVKTGYSSNITIEAAIVKGEIAKRPVSLVETSLIKQVLIENTYACFRSTQFAIEREILRWYKTVKQNLLSKPLLSLSVGTEQIITG